MPANHLITGAPGVGKSTVVDRTVRRLEAAGLAVGGVRSPEVREEGRRMGFEIVDVATGAAAVMAHRDREEGPSVGSYRVDVAAVAEVAGSALRRAREEADVAVVDEVAPMEVAADAFVGETRALLDDGTPTLAAVHQRSTSGFVGEVKDRGDAELVTVTEADRDDLPATLAQRLQGELDCRTCFGQVLAGSRPRPPTPGPWRRSPGGSLPSGGGRSPGGIRPRRGAPLTARRAASPAARAQRSEDGRG